MYDTFIVILVFICLVVGLIGIGITAALWFDQSISKRSKWWKRHIVGDAPEDWE